jgi:hypothetical protein
MKPAKRRRNSPRRPDDTGNTANKRPKAADRRPRQNQAGPSRDSHAASDSNVSDTDTGQNIRQNTDTTHPTHPDSNVRASNIDIQVGTFQRQYAVSTDQFPSHAPQQSGQQRCEESTPSHSAFPSRMVNVQRRLWLISAQGLIEDTWVRLMLKVHKSQNFQSGWDHSLSRWAVCK